MLCSFSFCASDLAACQPGREALLVPYGALAPWEVTPRAEFAVRAELRIIERLLFKLERLKVLL